MSRSSNPRPGALSAPAPLDAEWLEVYEAAVEFHRFAAALLPGHRHHALLEQLDRASRSMIVSVAEGARHASPEDKARHDAIARGCAEECAALVDSLRARGAIEPDRAARARSLMVRTARRLTGMVRRLRRDGGTRGDGRWSRP
jgi:four helix bundle protein